MQIAIVNVNLLLTRISGEHNNNDYSVGNTVRELYDLHDGVKQCEL